MAKVTGLVRSNDGSPALGALIRAFDVDLRSESLLGEAVVDQTSGRYEIAYTSERFRRAEKRSADIVVKAFLDGVLRAESAIIFNAPDEARIDLTLASLPAPPRGLSELDDLLAAIEPVLQDLAYRDFTDRDREFLSHEATRREGSAAAEQRILRERLQFVSQADTLAGRTDIPLAAFYGWFRVPDNRLRGLDDLLDLPLARLGEGLTQAMAQKIIPDITNQVPEIVERLRALRVEQGRLVRHDRMARLIGSVDERTERPLVGYQVDVVDLDAEAGEGSAGTVTTDAAGLFVLRFGLPAGAPRTAVRRLQLTVRDADATVTRTELRVGAGQSDVIDVRVPAQQDEGGHIAIEEAAPPALAARLRQQGIRSLRDLLSASVDVSSGDRDTVERLRGMARFAILSGELGPAERDALLETGLRRPSDLAAASRASFVRRFRSRLGGDAASYVTHFAARETRKLLHQMIGDAWLKTVTSPGDDDGHDPDIPTGVIDTLNGHKTCGCKDCQAAVSPAAYLAHLLDWTLEHVRANDDAITLGQLEEEFLQPFASLPASCAAVEQKVRLVRICVELLWRFTGLRDRTDLQLPFAFRNAYRHLRDDLYRRILVNLGTSFDQLQKATLDVEGDGAAADFVAAQRQNVANVLGIDAARIGDLFFNVDLSPESPTSPTENDLERLFGFKSTRAHDVFASPATPELVVWQREQLAAIWESQDWSIDAYVGEERLPFVEPAVIDTSHLRTPFDGNPAFALLEARQQELAAHRQTLVDANPRVNGLAQLLTQELGRSIGNLRALFASLRAPDAPEQVSQAQEAIAAMHVTPEGFAHLMEMDAGLQRGEAVAPTEHGVDAAWTAVFDVLSRRHRHTLYPAWVEAEDAVDLELGPKQFWLPAEPAAAVNPWLATALERGAWEDALRRRSRPPIVDPDQIARQYVVAIMTLSLPPSLGLSASPVLHLPALTVVQLWDDRRAWIDERLSLLRQSRQGHPASSDALEAMLDASTAGIDLDVLERLAGVEADGADLGPLLAQLDLTLPAYRFLEEIHRLAQGNAAIGVDRWRALEAILVHAEKCREFAAWRAAEQAAGIALDPLRFVIPVQPPPLDDSPHVRWLHDPVALDRWTATLEARRDQRHALDTALAQAVGDAEAEVLPLLRNVLVMESVAAGTSLTAKADWLDRRLLVDMRTDGCQMTTRVSQAIETLQRFVGGIYRQDHLDLMQHLTLDAEEDYEAEWPVLGAYSTWRAFMLAYLYPENLLHVIPPRFQSYGFARMKQKLPTRISPAEACAAAGAYADYFRDVCHLEVQASCQVRTPVAHDTGCEGVVAALRSRVHLFARATTSGRVYTATFDGYLDAEDTLDSWRPVPNLASVLEIIGAVPHETPRQQRLILLFAKVRAESANRLMAVTFDLDAASWGKPFELDLPPNTGSDFSAVAVQKRHGSAGETLGVSPPTGTSGADVVPTVLAIRAPNGRVYVRSLYASGTQWLGDDWIPLFGPMIAELVAEVHAVIQRSRHEYLMIVRGHDGWLKYRIFSTEPVIDRDDGFWRSIAKGAFAGAFIWPGTPEVYVFYEAEDKTKYAVIAPTADLVPGGLTRQTIGDLDGWLRTIVGISLDDFHLDVSRAWTFQPLPNAAADHRPLSAIPVEIPFKGSLRKLLELTVGQWEEKDNLPSGFDYAVFTAETYLKDLQAEGLRDFRDRISQIQGFHGSLGDWKLADWYVRQFAGRKGLASAVEDAFKSNPTTFRYRGFVTETRLVGTATSDAWRFVPSGGDEESGDAPCKTLALETADGVFRIKARRSGDILTAPALRRVAPTGDGPFALAPLAAKDDLQLRRAQIKAFYQDLDGSPPSVLAYVKEAFNLVPMALGYQLQRSGFYDEALLWFRQVYDYLQPAGKRKIDYSLQIEQARPLGYDAADAWLDDPSNAHAIAATRKNTSTRHALLMIVRCVVDYADRLFSRDNVTDNARARELYTLALKLLDSDVLEPAASSCANVIGELRVTLASGDVPVEQLMAVLDGIHEPDRLRAVATSIRAISQDASLRPVERLDRMREQVRTALADVPAPMTMSAVLDTKRRAYEALEDRYLAHGPSRAVLRKTHDRRRQARLTSLAEIAGRSEAELLNERPPLPWLREARATGADDREDTVNLAVRGRRDSRRVDVLDRMRVAEPLHTLTATTIGGFVSSAGISFDFCLPQNPVVTALRRRAENNLTKLRTCRNIAGMPRELDPYGAPIGLGTAMVSPDGTIFSGFVERAPTPYRYSALSARAKELVGIAQQIESGYQTALENAEREALSTLQAQQSVEQAAARIALQDLRLSQAHTELGLAQLQRDSAVLRETTYAGWIAAGRSQHESSMLDAYRDAGNALTAAASMRAAAQVAQMTSNIAQADVRKIGRLALYAGAQAAYAGAVIQESVHQSIAISEQTRAQIESFEASLERREDEWRLQQGVAALDVQIGQQQIRLAQDGIAIVQQERAIAGLEHTHAADTLEFLLTRTFTVEMYQWIASVLENVYRFFLQEATSVARLAERQLAFERQQAPLNVVQSDYWNVAADSSAAASDGNRVDRLGLTGSARLLKDLYQLDQYAFATQQLKQNLTIPVDLAQRYPVEFQQFRRTGVLVFETPLDLIDRQLPGHYLCLIQRVSVSVVALVPPTQGIRASLTMAGTSRVVVGGDSFQTVTIRNLPERIALTSPATTTDVIELEPDAQSLTRPFEGSGFATIWALQMAPAANPFDYGTIATVVFTLEVTALYSFDYERQVIERMGRRISTSRAFQFRQEFADAWYDLHNPAQTDAPMTVRFETRRADFPPNLEKLRLEHVALYFVLKDTSDVVAVEHLRFTPDGDGGALGGGGASIEGIISTRRGNGASWTPMLGRNPYGMWELAFPDTPEARRRFSEEGIEDILLVLTVGGETPAWPQSA